MWEIINNLDSHSNTISFTLQITVLTQFTAFFIGFTIKKLMQLMKG